MLSIAINENEMVHKASPTTACTMKSLGFVVDVKKNFRRTRFDDWWTFRIIHCIGYL